MSTSQFISVRETAQLLGITEKKVMDLIEEKKLQAYRIANKFLRLKKAEVLSLRNSGHVVKENLEYPHSPIDRVKDFFYFNDFYLLAGILIALLLYIIFYT
ncbi:MAG: helix-turn-helix domain-containing protein [Candidatus Omnitrophica bacterium]|nr:helix-turn-helix domain-containing protein [Candidatus Omnitrophota bacterium]